MNKILCKIFGHKYRLHRVINHRTREVKCTRCKKLFGMNDDVKALVPLDDDLLMFHETLLKW